MDKRIPTASFSYRLAGFNLPSPNPERMADFYQSVLGARIVNDDAHGGPHRIEIWFGESREGAPWITVHQDAAFLPPTARTCQGFEFRVADVDAEYRRIRALGIEMQEPPTDLPWGFRYFHLVDPDGNGIDIVAAL
ncbi:MAG: VOC family protein [Verrucomicrobiota bacterium JB024]|nr:VOC family protein [Verrucomicrobiota bacterium JB024]